MALKNLLPEATLQRCEPKAIVPIPLQNKLNEPVAESANAVIEDDGVGFGCWQTCQQVNSNERRLNELLELERLDVIVVSLVPMVDSLLGAGQLHEIGTLRCFDNCAAQAVDRVAVFWSAILRHSS